MKKKYHINNNNDDDDDDNACKSLFMIHFSFTQYYIHIIRRSISKCINNKYFV